MSEHTTNGHLGRIEQPILQDTDLRQKVRLLGRLLGTLALGCELVLDLNEALCGEGEG